MDGSGEGWRGRGPRVFLAINEFAFLGDDRDRKRLCTTASVSIVERLERRKSAKPSPLHALLQTAALGEHLRAS